MLVINNNSFWVEKMNTWYFIYSWPYFTLKGPFCSRVAVWYNRKRLQIHLYMEPLLSLRPYRPLGYERVYLPLCGRYTLSCLRVRITMSLNPYNAEIFVYKPRDQRVFSIIFPIIINVLFSSFYFIWIAMLCFYDHYKKKLFQCGETLDVRIWRIWTSDSDV